MTKHFGGFLAIFLLISHSDLAFKSSNSRLQEYYWCTKFEGNQSTRKLSLVSTKLSFKTVQRRRIRKFEENQGTYMYISQIIEVIYFKCNIYDYVNRGHRN